MQLNERARALLVSIIGDVAELLAIVGEDLAKPATPAQPDVLRSALGEPLASMMSKVTDGAARRYDVRDDNATGTGVSLNRGERGFSTRDKGQRNGSLEATILESAAGDASPATASEHSAGSRAVVDRALQQGQDLPPSTSPDEYTMHPGEVARLLGVTNERVRQLDAQLLPQRDQAIGRFRRYRRSDVERVLRARSASTTPATAADADPRPTPRVDRQPSPASSPSTPSPPYQPRAPVARTRADIEAATARLRAARTTAGLDAGARPSRGAARPLRTDVAEEVRPVEPALPTPIATFTF